mmetsp:Transcript_101575/g.291563  ORF Transcript_101575/g.291563 Transcript_101575/m.291563 type:complete len:174 (+) Transcript_101575:118-639(+)
MALSRGMGALRIGEAWLHRTRDLKVVSHKRLAAAPLSLQPTRVPMGLWEASRAFAGVGSAFRGPVQEHIEAKIRAELMPEQLEVVNESHGRQSDESHFHVLVVSEAFEGLSPLARHRKVSRLFIDEDGALKFHSLRITAQTPSGWARDSVVPSAPGCTGKGDGRGKVTDTSSL